MFRARLVGASLTLALPALLAISCSADATRPFGSGGNGSIPGAGGSGTAGGPAQCASMCSGACVDLTTSAANCGQCGNACPTATPFCVASACTSSCPTGTVACNGFCVDTKSSAANCGGCGIACGANQVCSNSVCVAGQTGSGGAGGMSSTGSGGSAGCAVVGP
ncbi:MAG TPA: hypothetical protein VGC79_33730, partial [Polyangiaceae bacterium]